MNPTQQILANLDAVRGAFSGGRGAKAAHDYLIEQGHELGKMPANTFKTVAPKVLEIIDALKTQQYQDTNSQQAELAQLRIEKAQLQAQNETLQTTLESVLQGYETAMQTVKQSVTQSYTELNNSVTQDSAMLNDTVTQNNFPLAWRKEVESMINERLQSVNAVKQTCITVAQPAQDVIQSICVTPKTFEGWTVTTTKEGFIKMHKRLNGVLTGLHVGRVWSDSTAHAKIQAKLAQQAIQQ